MDKVRVSSLLFILIIIFSLMPMISFADDDDRSYTIPRATFDLYVNENGNLKVKEKLHYSFSGTYNGVYRKIPLKRGERIVNLNVTTKGAYSSYEMTNYQDEAALKIYLYSNPAKTVPITDKEVDVFIEYDFINVIKIYRDVGELQFKVWGEEWDVDVGELTTNIHLKSKNDVKYWLNPPFYVSNDRWDGSVLKVVTNTIPTGNYFEVRLAIPKDQFKNPAYAVKEDINGLPIMEKIQKDYQNQTNFYNILYYILSILMVISIIIPVLVYFKYGREPKSTYQGIYQRELPSDDPPAVVNALSGQGFSKKIGNPNMDGFQATIMDLINRGYLGVSSQEKGHKKSVLLRIKENKIEKSPKLPSFEMNVIRFLRTMAKNHVIDMNQMKKELEDQENAKNFKEFYDLWEYELQTKFLEEKTSQFFIETGNKYIKIYGVGALIVAGIVFYLSFLSPPPNIVPASVYSIAASVILGIAGIISLVLPEKVGGRWTQEGIDYDAKWQAFKKYIMDFSQIKEYPPESVVVWNNYLVYATALGVADKVKKTMKMSLTDSQLNESNIYLFHSYGGYAILASGLSTGMTTATSGSGGSGGVGGVGGGSGGGGGGAF